MTPRPETFDVWEYLAWLRQYESELYVQVTDPKTNKLALVPLSELDPIAWRFWANRLFMDPNAPVKILREWKVK